MAKGLADIVVIGSGIGGLSCAALLARYGFDVTVCESYSLPGGAAHAFERNGFNFESGPSLYSGLSYRPSSNPLRQVLDAIGEDLPCVTYNTWGCCLPEGVFYLQNHFFTSLLLFVKNPILTSFLLPSPSALYSPSKS